MDEGDRDRHRHLGVGRADALGCYEVLVGVDRFRGAFLGIASSSIMRSKKQLSKQGPTTYDWCGGTSILKSRLLCQSWL